MSALLFGAGGLIALIPVRPCELRHDLEPDRRVSTRAMEEHEGRAVATFGSGSRDTGQLDLALHDGDHRQSCARASLPARARPKGPFMRTWRIAHTALMTLWR